MQRLALTLAISFSPLFVAALAMPAEPGPIKFAATDWPWWRGPTRDGIAASDQSPPLKWSETENVLWKVPVPGRGHGSATVVGNQVFLAIADSNDGIQGVLCLDRRTGEKLWQTPVHRGGLEVKGNAKSSLASASVACDGERLFINFLNGGAVHTTALTREGKILWQKKISEYEVHQGFGSSPALYGKLVLVSADHKGGVGVIAALNRADGETVWRHERPKLPNYTSPIIVRAAGRDQVVFVGCDLVAGFDPETGSKLWETPGATTECVTSTVTDGRSIFTSGGYPKNHISAIRADGSAKLVWENNARVYVPSMLVRDGYLYAALDAGAAGCWKCDDGKEMWKGRLGGTFSASPVLVGERIFVTNEAGKTFVFKASPTAFELLGENQLGEDVYATPTICGSRIYLRVAKMTDGRRDEWLYCVGE